MDQANYYYLGDRMLSESEKEKKSPLLLTFSKLPSNPVGGNCTHMHAFLEIFYFESGEGVLECEGQAIALSANDLLIVNAGAMHIQYSLREDAPLVYYNLAVDRLQIEGLLPNCIPLGGCGLHSFGTAENGVYPVIRMMARELEEQGERYAAKVYSLFQALMVDMLRLFHTGTSVEIKERRGLDNQALLSVVKEYMESHYAEDLTLESLARLATMQKGYFLQQFKKKYGISPLRYLNLIRMETAKLLLTGSDKQITEIAAAVGYHHAAYFSEMFLKSVGVSPSGYRKLIVEQEKRYPGSLRNIGAEDRDKQMLYNNTYYEKRNKT